MGSAFAYRDGFSNDMASGVSDFDVEESFSSPEGLLTYLKRDLFAVLDTELAALGAVFECWWFRWSHEAAYLYTELCRIAPGPYPQFLTQLGKPQCAIRPVNPDVGNQERPPGPWKLEVDAHCNFKSVRSQLPC